MIFLHLVGYLIEKLKENEIFDDVNIIITSDHGMASLQQTIPVLPHIDSNKTDKLLIRGTWAHIWPKPSMHLLIPIILCLFGLLN